MGYRPFRRTRQPATPLERGFYRVYQLSSLGSAAAIACFIGYVFGGFSLYIAGIYTPSFPVMSLTEPFFTEPSLVPSRDEM
jgi:hypothetical protein